MSVAKAKCHVVSTMGKRKPAVSRIHLLKMMIEDESVIQVAMYTAGCRSLDGGAGFSDAGLTVGRTDSDALLTLKRSCSPDCRSLSDMAYARDCWSEGQRRRRKSEALLGAPYRVFDSGERSRCRD